MYWYEKQKDTNYQCLEKLSLISQKETEWQNCPSQAIDELINDRDRNTTFRARQKEKRTGYNSKPHYRYNTYR